MKDKIDNLVKILWAPFIVSIILMFLDDAYRTFGFYLLILTIIIHVPVFIASQVFERLDYFKRFKTFFSDEELGTDKRIYLETPNQSIRNTIFQWSIIYICLFILLFALLTFLPFILPWWISIPSFLSLMFISYYSYEKLGYIHYNSKDEWIKWRDRNNK